MTSGESFDDAVVNGQSSADSAVKFDDVAFVAKNLQHELSGKTFDEWYREREHTKNIRKGRPYFNGPGRIKPPRRHSPSQLLQCKRKTIYRQLKAPEEIEEPTGIFGVGSRIEEDLVLPFLEDLVAQEGLYVTNSVWVDFHLDTGIGEVQIKGSTDPVVVDDESNPILLFEVKTKQSLDNLTRPNTHHRAQAMAYLYGLNEKYDHTIENATILYIGRSNLNFKAFDITFDSTFWNNTVIPWINDVTAYRLERELPPAEPEFDWECEFCSYKERCGKGERTFEDQPPQGLLPLFEYPKQQVIDYLEVHESKKLTPTLAHLYPDLARKYDVARWYCGGCGAAYEWDEIDWDGDLSNYIKCDRCAKDGSTRYLRGPVPGAKRRGES